MLICKYVKEMDLGYFPINILTKNKTMYPA